MLNYLMRFKAFDKKCKMLVVLLKGYQLFIL